MTYTYACPECGTVELFRPAKDHKTTICECGSPATRVDNDFCQNLMPPFKEFTAFGVGGKRGKLITSPGERKRVLNPGWKNDMYWPDDRELVTPDEFDKMMDTDSRVLGARNKD